MSERSLPMIESLVFRAPLALKQGIETAAEQAGKSASSWIRDTIAERLSSLGLIQAKARTFTPQRFRIGCEKRSFATTSANP